MSPEEASRKVLEEAWAIYAKAHEPENEAAAMKPFVFGWHAFRRFFIEAGPLLRDVMLEDSG